MLITCYDCLFLGFFVVNNGIVFLANFNIGCCIIVCSVFSISFHIHITDNFPLYTLNFHGVCSPYHFLRASYGPVYQLLTSHTYRKS